MNKLVWLFAIVNPTEIPTRFPRDLLTRGCSPNWPQFTRGVREIDKALSEGVNMSFLSSMNIREKTLQKISERFQGVWAFTKLAMVDTKSRLSVTRLLLFIVQQSTTGSFLSFIFSSICHFIFPPLPLFVFSSLCLFVPSHVYCSPVTKRVASQTVLNEFGESSDALLWIQNKIFTTVM